jgi:glycosyltransferase involved in cell wall biosynthesis
VRIGVDASPLVGQQTGVQTYIINILAELAKIDATNDYFLYSNGDFENPVGGGRWQKRVGHGLGAAVALLWLQTQALRMIQEDRIDIFWGTFHFLPLLLPETTKTVLTIHDLVFHWFPETLTRRSVLSHRLCAQRSAAKADILIPNSQSTARDVRSVFHVGDGKIQVVYPGVDTDFFHPHPKEEAMRYLRHEYGLSARYILTVGTVEPRKNQAALIKAFARLRKESHIDHQLVVVGGVGWKSAHVFDLVRQLKLGDDVRFLGHIPEGLPMLYSGAEVFVFPSLYEGFGFPPLEAMACGCPVVVSDNSSLPEVVGEAGLLVEAEDVAGLAEMIGCVLSHCPLRERMIACGLEQARTFSWEKCAAGINGVFQGLGAGLGTVATSHR